MSSAYCCRRPYELTICAIGEMNKEKGRGPMRDPYGIPMVQKVTGDVEQVIRTN